MRSDRYRKIRESDIPPMQVWARKISGINKLKIVLANKSKRDSPVLVAWIVTVDPPIIYLDRKSLNSKDENVLYLRVYMLHEIGHLLTNAKPGNKEYLAHHWAIKKSLKLGLLYELRLLQAIGHSFFDQSHENAKTYRQAAQQLLKEGLL